MTVPKIRFTDAGVSIPEEPQILDGVLAEIDVAFGGGLNKSLSTPQGQLAQSLTAIIGDKNTQILEVSNQIDPARNSGRWQDAIGRIYFMERIAGRGTVVQATCYGLVNSLIPAGSLAQDSNGLLPFLFPFWKEGFGTLLLYRKLRKVYHQTLLFWKLLALLHENYWKNLL